MVGSTQTIKMPCTGYLNDLWKYRVIDNTWIWISGTNATDQLGEYGEKGEPSKNNYPGGRAYPIGWFDSTTQELWLFGGKCPVNNSTDGAFNHLVTLHKQTTC